MIEREMPHFRYGAAWGIRLNAFGIGDVNRPNKKSRLSAPPTIGFQPHKSPLGQRSFVMHTQILTQTDTKVKGVFTKRLMNTLSVTITSVALLIGFVGSSSADEFTVSMTSGDKNYYSDYGYITHTAEVETSHVFNKVDWYVNGTRQATTQGDGAKKTASFTKGFSGHGPGKTYRIKAFGESEDGDCASDLQIVTVYKNVVDHDGDDDFGYVEVAKCEWRGNTAYAEMCALVNNSTGKGLTATMVFRFEVVRLDKNKHLDKDIKLVQPFVEKGKTVREPYNRSFTPDFDDIPEGVRVKLGAKITCSASGGTWTASHETIHIVE